MRRSALRLTVLAALLLPPVVSGLHAQSSPAQSRRSVLVGCLQRAGSPPRYMLNDSRGGTFVVQGDRQTLDYHVGHTVEMWGLFQGSGDNPTFRVESVIYLSGGCQ